MVVWTDQRDGIAFLTIDNPPVNALSRDVRLALLERIRALSTADDVKAIVLRGANDTFVAGADLREFGKPLTEPTMPAVIAAIEACPKPVVAAIGGFALGGGYELALGCDARVALVDAAVGLPEGTFGIIPGSGGTVRTTRLVDPAIALELISSCRRIKAPEAATLRLVDAIVGDLDRGAANFAIALKGQKRRLRDLPPKAVLPDVFEKAAQSALRRGRNRPYAQEQVAALRRAFTVPFKSALVAERAAFQRLRDTEESAALRYLFFAEREASKVEGLVDAKPRAVRSIGIVGAGTMGSGIAAAFLSAGLSVTLVDSNPEALSAAGGKISDHVAKAPNPGVIRLTSDLADIAECDLVLEAVFEDMGVKRGLMQKLDALVRPDTVIASNTSYLDLDAIAAATLRPDRVVGLHFFAPAHIMKLLEVVRGAKTSPDVLATALKLGRTLGKVGVVARVGEGFIGNRIYNAYRAECEALLLAGASPDQIDAALEAFGFAMGPFAVSDMSGLDIGWANRKRKQEETGVRSADVPVLQWLVEAGRLGRKAGAGWYRYDAAGRGSPDEAVSDLITRARQERGIQATSLTASEIADRAMAAIVNEALLVLEDGIAQRASDIDLVIINGYGFPRHLGGPLHWAANRDATDIAGKLDRYASRAPDGRRQGSLRFLTDALRA